MMTDTYRAFWSKEIRVLITLAQELDFPEAERDLKRSRRKGNRYEPLSHSVREFIDHIYSLGLLSELTERRTA